MPNVYRQEASAGYGARIFVPYEHVHALRCVLDPICSWGGADKDTGKAEGWEFGTSESMENAVNACRKLGFIVLSFNDKNYKEVW